MDTKWLVGLAALPVFAGTTSARVAPSPVCSSSTSPLVGALSQQQADERYQFLAALCEEKLWSQAVEQGRSFLGQYPRDPRVPMVRYRLGFALFEQAQLPEAKQQFEQLARLKDFEFAGEVQLRLGQCLRAEEKWSAAAQAFGKARASQKPELLAASTYLQADSLLNQGDWKAADELFGALNGIEGAEVYRQDASLGRIWCAFQAQDWQRCDQLAKAYLKAAPKSEHLGEVHFLAGESAAEGERWEAALASYREVTGASKTAEQVWLDDALRGEAFALLALERFDQAGTRFGRLIELDAKGPFAEEARLQQGICWVEIGRAADAIQVLSHPVLAERSAAWEWKARAQQGLAQSQEALTSLQRALNLKDLDPARRGSLHELQGDLLLQLGRSEEAATSFSSSDTDYGSHAACIALWNAGQMQAAEQRSLQYLQKYPQGAYRTRVLLTLGELCLSDGRRDRAVGFLDQVIEASSDADEVCRAKNRRAWCALEAGQASLAFDGFSDVVGQCAGSPQAAESLFFSGRAARVLWEEQNADSASGSQTGRGFDPGRAVVTAWSRYLKDYSDGEYALECRLELARFHFARGIEFDSKGVELLSPWLDVDAGSEASTERERQLVAAGLIERADAWGRLAEVEQKPELQQKALADYERLLKEHGDSPWLAAAHYGAAFALYETGSFEAVLEQINQLRKAKDFDATQSVGACELALFAAMQLEDGAGLDRALVEMKSFRAALLKLGQSSKASDVESERGGVGERLQPSAQALSDALRDRGRHADVFELWALLVADMQSPEARSEAHAQAALAALDLVEHNSTDGAISAGQRQNLEAATQRAELALQASALPMALEAAFFAGEHWYQLGEYERAAKSYQAVIDQPQAKLRPAALYKAGFALLEQDQLAKAAKSFESLVRDHADSELCGEALYLCGETRFRSNELESAFADLDRFVREYPQHSAQTKALFRLGLCGGQLAKANSANAEAKQVRSYWLRSRDALALLVKTDSAFPAMAEVQLWLGRAHVNLDEWPQAQVALGRAFEKDRGRVGAQARLELGKGLEARGNQEEALNQLLKVALLYSDEDSLCEARFRSAVLLQGQGNLEAARRQVEALQREHPKSPWTQSANQLQLTK